MSIFSRLGRIIQNEIKQKVEEIYPNQKDIFWDNFAAEDAKEAFKDLAKTYPNRNELQNHLDLFDLSEPVDYQKLRKKRNQILHQYHPDRFESNTPKQIMAKELIQTYNESYRRILEITGRK